jgi:hypothetical protein
MRSGSRALVDQRTKNSARQPRSTQMPRRSIPQVLPWTQAEPLICRLKRMSRRPPTSHQLRGAKAAAAADGEVGAASAIDPEAAAVDTPGLTLNAGRAADLADELCVASAADVAPVSAAIVGGAVDGLLGRPAATANDELGAAATVDPEAAAVDTPGLALNAGGAADLADELSVARAADVAPVSAAVIRGAGDARLRPVAGLRMGG